MARDPKLWKRNAFVLPGGILTLYALAGLFYVFVYRTPTPACSAAHRFLVTSHCYSAYPFLGAILILGVALVTVGLVVFRGKPVELPGHLHSGTPTHFALALMASLVVVPALVWLVLYYVEASQNLRPFATPVAGVEFQTKFLFLILAVGAALALVPFLGLYVAQGRLRRTFLKQVEDVAAQEGEAFPGETARPAAEPLLTPPPEEFVDEALWPASRGDEPVGAPPVAPTTPPTPALAPATSAPTAPAAPPVPVVAAVTGAVKPAAKGPTQAAAPVVTLSAGCRAILATGHECGKPVGPGGRYCVGHACQGATATGAPCRNPAMEGSTRCPAHAA